MKIMIMIGRHVCAGIIDNTVKIFKDFPKGWHVFVDGFDPHDGTVW